MDKIYLSDSGPKVSKAIYSLWRWESEKIFDEKEVKAAIIKCLELGVNTFELSASVSNLALRKVFFETLKEKKVDRADVVILAKFGVFSLEDGTLYNDNSRKTLLSQVKSFLEETSVEYLDIFLLDGLDYITEIEEIAETLEYLQHIGYVKHIGVANFSTSKYRLLSKYLQTPIVTNHLEFNLLNAKALFDGRVDNIKEAYGKALAWSPLANGEILEGTSSEALTLRGVLEKVAEETGYNVEQIAVSWLLNLGVLPVIGSKSLSRIQNVAASTPIKLSHTHWYTIYEMAKHISNSK